MVRGIHFELLGNILDMKGVDHEWAENGKIALERFEQNPDGYYDAILMDIQMPVMDGLEATAAIRALKDKPQAKTIPIIALSANAFTEDIQKSMQAGMTAHLSKPVDIKELLDAL